MSDDRTPEESEREQSARVEALREYKQGKHLKIHLVNKIDTLKPGQWWIWSCLVEDTAGRMREAIIQSDGHNHELSTLEYE